AQMISSIANDGMLVKPRIVAGEVQSQDAPQKVAFHPTEERRVISTTTAALMRQMMQGVVLHGTGKKATLEGYSAGGKTGTAQKFDPVTHKYSHTNFYSSFAGFAPINNPAITVVVMFDSPMAPTILQREGGWQGAPVFQRIAQQVLEYLHTPHDLEIPADRRVLMARSQASANDLDEGAPDHIGESIDDAGSDSSDTLADATASTRNPAPSGPAPASTASTMPGVVPASLRRRELSPVEAPRASAARQTTPQPPSPAESANTTVVMDVEQGGIVVPSFLGKSVRSSIELAENSGLELDVVGSGTATDQSPAPGSHVASGTTITVRFGR
ncbi:MAG TPA: penicillin-binding transpeptidase domain-containing protein, partial [Terriglobales bacterium]